MGTVPFFGAGGLACELSGERATIAGLTSPVPEHPPCKSSRFTAPSRSWRFWPWSPAAVPPASSRPQTEQSIAPADRAAALASLYEEYWEASLALNPVLATFIGDSRYNAELPDYGSKAYRDQSNEFLTGWLGRAEAIGATGLYGQDLLNYEIFIRMLRSALESQQFPGWMLPVNQMSGIHSLAAQLGSGRGAQPFRTVQDYDDWLARAGRLPVLLETNIANMREGIAADVVQPRPLMEKVLPQLDGLIVDAPEESVFWGPIAALPEDFPTPTRPG
jgi:uncharacterized protein (DUF885 family)